MWWCVQVVAHVRDQVIGVSSSEVFNNTSEEDFPAGVCLGASGEGQVSFTGSITAFSILVKEKGSGGVILPTDCTNLVPQDVLLALDPSSWASSGDVLILHYDAALLCAEIFTTLLLPFNVGQIGHLDLCKVLSGRFPSVQEVETTFVDVNQMLNSSCVTDGKVLAWVGHNTSNKGIRTVCPVLLTNGTVGSRPCVSSLKCFLCLVPAATRFLVFGALSGLDRAYTVTATQDWDLQLTGEDTSEIVREGDEWVIRSKFHNNEWRLKGSPLPVGRWMWETRGIKDQFTLTPCSKKQFSCDHGQCIPRDQLCDGIEHCSNDSDERNCEILELPKGYDNNTRPFAGDKELGEITYDVGIYYISDITTLNSQVTLDMYLQLQWYDKRLKYWNLKHNDQQVDCKNIWIPLVSALAGYKSGMTYDTDDYASSCAVLVAAGEDVKELQQQSFDDPMMGAYLTGPDVTISFFTETRLTVPCKFQLQRYPFGSQICNITFYLRMENGLITFKKKDETTVLEYTGSTDLLEYRLSNLTVETPHDYGDGYNYSYIVLSLHLESLSEYHILNSFAPSALVFLISLSTLFFPLKDFNERVMVSLTSLLVLSGFFANTGNSSVRTPYFKLLDVWYASLILLSFIVVIANAIVHSLVQRTNTVAVKSIQSMDGWCNEVQQHDDRKANICNNVIIIILVLIFLAVIVVFVLIALQVL
ncbi:uncharacterized protein LOC121856074 [Homarus americanus]|uniref:uncharacterized protein LOC121856074 n=1 Tax=Homarus americanus TaxID=6706 RepID=UPI001C4935A8|nr:uncharacterized protein LOC121856074 [Homarus americanus]